LAVPPCCGRGFRRDRKIAEQARLRQRRFDLVRGDRGARLDIKPHRQQLLGGGKNWGRDSGRGAGLGDDRFEIGIKRGKPALARGGDAHECGCG
jgi:hypothetical protein